MKSLLSLMATGIVVAGVAGCELNVTNPNDADRGRALASPSDVETLIASSYVSGYWESAQYRTSWGASFEVMSNHGSASWGNHGMNDTGREPREPLPNQSSYSYAYIFEQPWADNYLGISGATEGIRAVMNGLEIGAGGEDNPRAMAFATFVQGVSHCALAAGYDKGFLLDENVDFEAEAPVALPYAEVAAFGIEKLEAAEALAQGNTFTLPSTWLNGAPLTNTEFAALIRGYRARCRANVARDPAERGSIDWPSVRSDASTALGDLIIEAEETGAWTAGLKVEGCGSEEATWCRMHLDFTGQGDVSGAYQAWLAIPLQQRLPMDMVIPDQRWPQSNVDGEVGPYTNANFPRGYYEYISTDPFPASRGTYRWSHYGSNHWEDYVDDDFGPIAEMLQTEMDLLQAEAALEMGDIPATVALVNLTRVGHGGLPAVVDGGTVPGGGSCVPRKRFDPAGTCGDLRDALQWEHYNEIFQVSAGQTFFFTRRQGELPAGTALHYPIPAAELETLQEDIYTWGGDPGAPGSAGQPSFSIAAGGSQLEVALARATRILDLWAERRALTEVREADRVLR